MSDLIQGEVWEMLQYSNDWQDGHTPVTTGRAPWLPTPFVQAMHVIAGTSNEETARRLERKRAERGQ